jgi:hypothetical protein
MLFMVASALVMNLRYKPLDESDALYLDTWTGKIEASVSTVPAPRVAMLEAPKLEASVNGLEIILLEKLNERKARLEKIETECGGVRFAFPAPVTRPRR